MGDVVVVVRDFEGVWWHILVMKPTPGSSIRLGLSATKGIEGHSMNNSEFISCDILSTRVTYPCDNSMNLAFHSVG